MSGVKVKICGITRPEDALTAAEAGAWAIGLVFYTGSPRRVSARQARRIASALPKGVLKVGVFMEQTLEEIRALDAEAGLDLLQVHEDKTRMLCRSLGPERCIEALALKDEDSVEKALGSEAAYLLLDRPRPGGRPVGGPLDLGLAQRVALGRPRTILAGGLTAQNVGEAVRRVMPWGVDVSGSVESAAGIKNAAGVSAFLQAVRGSRP